MKQNVVFFKLINVDTIFFLILLGLPNARFIVKKRGCVRCEMCELDPLSLFRRKRNNNKTIDPNTCNNCLTHAQQNDLYTQSRPNEFLLKIFRLLLEEILRLIETS